MISEVDDQNETIGSDADSGRSIHLIKPGSLRAELAFEHAIRAEYLNAVVAAVGNYYVALVVDGAALWAQKLPVAAALAAEELGRLEVRVNDEQTVVVEVRHDYLVLLIERDAARTVELLPQRAVEAVLVEELTVRVEQLDAVVASVRDEDVRLARHCYVPWVVEVRAWFAAFFAEFEQKCAVWLEYLLNNLIVLTILFQVFLDSLSLLVNFRLLIIAFIRFLSKIHLKR